MAFTSHNIKLQDGSYTIPEMDGVLEDGLWLRSAIRYINLTFGGEVAGKSVIDLGCLEGGYTVAFARMGMKATGLEVRTSNFENCEYVRQRVGDLALNFVKRDAWEAAECGMFDVVFCSGLLYHLDRPRAFIDLMSSCAKKMVIIHTHYAPEMDSEAFTLSPFENHEGCRGRWYKEHDSENIAEIEGYSWSSWMNKSSFWLDKAEIINALKINGFNMVFEAFDFLGDSVTESMRSGYYATQSRGMFVGVRD